MQYGNIQGWFDFGKIYDEILAIAPNNSSLVEVGCWKGKSTCYMAAQIKSKYVNKNLIFYAIDTWQGSLEDQEYIQGLGNYGLYRMFLQNMCKTNVIQHITPIPLPSAKASIYFEDNSLFFVYLNAKHDYENVKLDIESWYPKVQIDGYIGGHDYPNAPGVKLAVEETFTNITNKCASWLIQKHDNNIFNM